GPQRSEPQHHERPAPPYAPGLTRGGDKAERGEEEPGAGASRAQHIQQEGRADHEQQRQKPRILEAERGDVHHEGCPFMSSYCSATAARRIASSADRTACRAREG